MYNLVDLLDLYSFLKYKLSTYSTQTLFKALGMMPFMKRDTLPAFKELPVGGGWHTGDINEYINK